METASYCSIMKPMPMSINTTIQYLCLMEALERKPLPLINIKFSNKSCYSNGNVVKVTLMITKY